MFQNIGFTELLLIAVVALVLFGPQKLPEIGRVLGRTIRDFKKGAHALLNDESEETAAPKPVAEVKPAPQVSTQGEAASSDPVEAGAISKRAAVEFVTAAPSLVKSAVESVPATPEVAESGSSATAEHDAVHEIVQPEQASAHAASTEASAVFAATAATIPTDATSASSAVVSAVEAPSVTPATPAQTHAAPAPSAAVPAVNAPSVTQTAPARPNATPASSAVPAAPSSNARRLPD